MNELKIFEKENFKVRVIEKGGETWFVAKDIALMLDLDVSNIGKVLERVSENMKGRYITATHGGDQEVWFVNEPGVYKLVFTSRKPEAEKFTDWLAIEVIPSIRKHGMYATESTIDKIMNNPEFLTDILLKLKDESERRKKAEQKVTILTHDNKTYTATEIAKELGFRSANALNEDLRQRKVQYKVNDTWVLYGDYSSSGYVNIKQQVLDSGKIVYDRKFTGTGREFLIELYKGAN